MLCFSLLEPPYAMCIVLSLKDLTHSVKSWKAFVFHDVSAHGSEWTWYTGVSQDGGDHTVRTEKGTLRLSNYQTDCHTIKIRDCQTVSLSDRQTV